MLPTLARLIFSGIEADTSTTVFFSDEETEAQSNLPEVAQTLRDRTATTVCRLSPELSVDTLCSWHSDEM